MTDRGSLGTTDRLRNVGLPAGLVLLLCISSPSLGRSQPADAADVLEAALDRHRERARGIVGLIQVARIGSADDDTVTLRFRRDTVAGVPVFAPEAPSLASTLGSGSSARLSRDPWSFLARHGERMTYRGTERMAGRTVHVLTLDELSGTALEGGWSLGPLLERLTIDRIRLDLDGSLHVPRRVVTTGEAVWRDRPREVRYEVRYSDFRSVDGWLHPHLVEGTVEIELTRREREELDASVEALRRRLEDAPPEQRATLETNLERLSAMAEGILRFSVETRELELRRR